MAIVNHQQVLLALHILSNASERTLQDIPNVRSTLAIVQKKIGIPQKVDVVDRLFATFEKNLSYIEEYLKKDVTDAVGTLVWLDEDPRIVEFCIEAKKASKSGTNKFRAHLGCRSLALEYEDWELEKYKTSRINRLVKKLSRANDRHGHVKEFLQWGHFKHPVIAKDALNYGIKIIVVERLYKCRGISLLLAFSYTSYKSLRYDQVEKFLASLPNFANIDKLAKESSQFIKDCQLYYNDLCSRYSESESTQEQSDTQHSPQVSTLGSPFPSASLNSTAVAALSSGRNQNSQSTSNPKRIAGSAAESVSRKRKKLGEIQQSYLPEDHGLRALTEAAFQFSHNEQLRISVDIDRESVNQHEAEELESEAIHRATASQYISKLNIVIVIIPTQIDLEGNYTLPSSSNPSINDSQISNEIRSARDLNETEGYRTGGLNRSVDPVADPNPSGFIQRGVSQSSLPPTDVRDLSQNNLGPYQIEYQTELEPFQTTSTNLSSNELANTMHTSHGTTGQQYNPERSLSLQISHGTAGSNHQSRGLGNAAYDIRPITGSLDLAYPTGSLDLAYPTGSLDLAYPTGSLDLAYRTGNLDQLEF
ncbi:MAG: hypothetical protein M1834_009741 [Cirrosporium novae-zelandiae]|nr:MAG: hypothetical protein M1834_009741 [Cirrosporium novae-zelandiae]